MSTDSSTLMLSLHIAAFRQAVASEMKAALRHPLAVERALRIAERIEKLGEHGPRQAASAAIDILITRHRDWLASIVRSESNKGDGK